MKNKKAEALSEGVVMIYRIVLISFIALVIFGISGVYYSYYINVKDVEAMILAKKVNSCIAEKGILNLNNLVGVEKSILNYCGIKGDLENFYVKAEVTYEKNGKQETRVFEQGDSGAKWVLSLYNSGKTSENIANFKPGFFKNDPDYEIIVSDNGKLINGKLKTEAFVKNEE